MADLYGFRAEAPELVLAKMDIELNDAENAATFRTKNFPILMLYTKENKKGVQYSGKTKYESIKKWAVKNGL